MKVILTMLECGQHLITIPYVQKHLVDKHQIVLSKAKIRSIVTKDLDLVYKRVGSLEEYVNTSKNILLRQLMAEHLIKNVFNPGKIVINFDECHFKESTSKAYSWTFRGRKRSRTYKKIDASTNLFLCVIEDGGMVYQLTTGNNNEVTFSSWLFDLSKILDQSRPGWRTTHVVLMDNARSHKSETTKSVIRHLGIPTIFTAPGSMTCLPVE